MLCILVKYISQYVTAKFSYKCGKISNFLRNVVVTISCLYL